MRKTMLIAVCFLVSGAAFAQQDKPNTFHVFLTNPGYVSSDLSGSHYTGAYGLGFQRMFTPHFSAEASLLRESRFGGRLPNRTPLDLTARYHFFTDSSWKPYAGAGVRLVDGNSAFDLNGGVVWQFHRTLGLRFDAKVMAGDKSTLREMTNGSIGLSWRF
jgi:hypothetical protein